jgi:predicted 2-oxoglutarate/Fe(II)-dependent dioxygenase YbiX
MGIQINGIFPGELHPDATVGGCIDIFENAWPNPTETVQIIENQTLNPDSGMHWTRATTVGQGFNQDVRTNYHLGITACAQEFDNPVAKDLHNQTYFLLLASTIPYARKHDVEEMYHEPYNMLRYRDSQQYKAHIDGTTDMGRCISAIIYLNNDYEGGEIEFVNFGIKIKPEPGMLLLFPSNYAYRHIAHPVINGTKYAIVTWIKDRQL